MSKIDIDIKVNADTGKAVAALSKVSSSASKAKLATGNMQKALSQLQKSGSRSLNMVGEAVSKLTTNLSNAANSAVKMGMELGKTKIGMKQMAVGAAAAFWAVDKLVEHNFKLTNVMGNLPFTINKARTATLGLISDLDLATAAAQANALGVVKNGDEFATLAALAVKLGAAVGGDARTSLDSLTLGLGRGQVAILDNVGITLKAEDAYKAYAAQVGKLARNLDDAEKKQAIVTMALERGSAMAEKITLKQDGATEAWIRTKAELKNIADIVLPAFLEAFASFLEITNAITDAIGRLGEKGSLILQLMDETDQRGIAMTDLQKTRAEDAAILAKQQQEAALASSAAVDRIMSAHGKKATEAWRQAGFIFEGVTQKAQKLIHFAPKASDASRGVAEMAKAMEGLRAGPSNSTIADDKFLQDAATQAEAEGLANRALLVERDIELSEIKGESERNINELVDTRIQLLIRQAEVEGDLMKVAELRHAQEVTSAQREAQMRRKILAEEKRRRDFSIAVAESVGEAHIGLASNVARATALQGASFKESLHGFAKANALEFALSGAAELVRAAIAAASYNFPKAAAHVSNSGLAFGQAAVFGAIAGASSGGVTARGGGPPPLTADSFGSGRDSTSGPSSRTDRQTQDGPLSPAEADLQRRGSRSSAAPGSNVINVQFSQGSVTMLDPNDKRTQTAIFETLRNGVNTQGLKI